MRSPRSLLTRIASSMRLALASLRAPAPAPEAEAEADLPELSRPAMVSQLTPMTAVRSPAMKIRDEAVGAVMAQDQFAGGRVQAFDPLQPAPGVLADGGLAMDAGMLDALGWAGNATLDEGLTFLGYPYLAQLSQRPEYRKPSEIIAKEMTRRWIKFTATGSDDKAETIAVIEAEFKRLKVQDTFRQAIETDGFFGRSHVYLDMGDIDEHEARMPLSVSKYKIKRDGLKAIKLVEPQWTYPDGYNSTNPLAQDFYKPQRWHVMGRLVHASRMLTMVSRQVPDILKPAYGFGGLSLSQIGKPYVDNWLRTRQSVSDAVHNFSVTVLQTNMSGVLSGGGGDAMRKRAALFNKTRDNQGLMMLDKADEDLKNVSMPLGGLDHLQAQAQEQMSAVWSIPLVVLTGITPSGLNASSEGELEVWHAWVHAEQETNLRPPLQKILDIVQIAKFGAIDPSITFTFEPLEVESDKDKADTEKVKVDTDVAAINAGIITPHEARARLAGDADSAYQALDLSEEADPEPPGGEGGDPDGGGFPGGEGDGEDDDQDGGGNPPAFGQPAKPAPAVKPEAAPAPNASPAPAPTPAAPKDDKGQAQDAALMRAAGQLLMTPEGRVLLLKRSAGAGDHAGEWCFPAGKIDGDETALQAAEREATEEIGRNPDGAIMAMLSDESEGVHFTTFVKAIPGMFVPELNDEHTGFMWASPWALPVPMHPGPAATLRELQAATLAQDAGQWNESDHPRAGNGQFGAGGSKESATKSAPASLGRTFIPADLYAEAERTIALYHKEDPAGEPLTDAEKAKATSELAQHLAAAHAAKPDYDGKMKAIGEKLGAEVKLAGIKTGDRLLEKHIRENGSNPAEMKDLVRGSLIVKSLDDVGPALQAIGRDFKVARVKDRFAKPMDTGYSDILINVELPGGILGEVQIHVPEMLASKNELGHALYNVERKLPAGPVKDQLVELQKRVYGAATEAAKKKVSAPRKD